MSFSQYGEDNILIEFARRHDIKINGCFIDIGASDGQFLSNSRLFIELFNMPAILCEPIPEQAEKIKEFYKTEIFVSVENVAIGKVTGKQKFYLNSCSDLSGLTNKKEDSKEIEVMCFTYEFLLKKYKLYNTQIDIISIDTEGTEIEIIDQILDCPIWPKFLIIESNEPFERFDQMNLLIDHYDLIYANRINTIWVKKGIIKNFWQ